MHIKPLKRPIVSDSAVASSRRTPFGVRLARGLGLLWRRFAPDQAVLPDMDEEDSEVIKAVRGFTMTSPERLCGLMTAVRYVAASEVPGDIVECGVWKGGSMMAVAETLLRLGSRERRLHLFDTFAGMTPPTEKDGSRFGTKSPAEYYQEMRSSDGGCQWCWASLEETRENLLRTGYPQDRIRFVKGPVQETIPAHAPATIALLRLDTDFYDSTKHELVHLFPRLQKGGVLLLDDYGHWEGQRLAVEEYFAEHKIHMLLSRLDYSARIGVKLG